MEIVVATQNPGKLTEFSQILSPLGHILLTPAEVGLAELEVEETGTTFAENAELKAKAFAEASGKPALADDSGLSVQALAGEPGVYSKRIGSTDPERMKWVLEQLQNQPDRTAWFTAVLCLYDPQTAASHLFEGKVMGSIAQQQVGDSGFGYDPIFIPEGHTQTFGQLGAEVKNKLSHRAQALQQLQDFLAAS